MTTSTSVASAATVPAALLVEPEPPRIPLRERPQATLVDPALFRETLAYVKAKPAELKWASIPWQTDLWEARRLAAEQGKPIFAWMMNGNPLGCV